MLAKDVLYVCNTPKYIFFSNQSRTTITHDSNFKYAIGKQHHSNADHLLYYNLLKTPCLERCSCFMFCNVRWGEAGALGAGLCQNLDESYGAELCFLMSSLY